MHSGKTNITNIPAPIQADGKSCLVLIYPKGPDMGRQFALNQNEIIIGRDDSCDIQIDISSVSRNHLKISKKDTEWIVEDLGSTNGSYLNDNPIQKSTLRNSDFLKIGSVIFKFLTGTSIESSYYEEIYRLTIIDALTGIHNHRYLTEFLEREVARSSRHHLPLSVLLLDIDHFKNVNDEFGHPMGDAVLRELTQRIRPYIRREELFARYGGEEFMIIMPNTLLEKAMTFSEKIRNAIESAPFTSRNLSLSLTISIGVSSFHGNQKMDPDQLIKQSDFNLYQAKKAGRNNVIGSQL